MVLERTWKITEDKQTIQKRLSTKLNISPVLAQVLINRGLDTTEEINDFLNVSLDGLHSPFLLKGMEKAVNRISNAVEANEVIAIYGDYDVDGITSTGALINFFQQLDIEVKHHIPNRLDEGYGLNKGAIKKISESGVKLVITVDCGISDYLEVEYANQLGIDIIITDHHEVPDQLPQAEAIINAKQSDCNYPFPELCGVGVAFKLIHGLTITNSNLDEEIIKDYLDLVTLGTVADIVPLIGENRIIVKHGLEILKNSKSLGVNALVEVSNLQDREIGTGHIGYILAPKINAAGRIGNPDLALKLLITKQPTQAKDIAQELKEINQDRKDIQAEILKEAELMIEGINLDQTKVLVLASERWHSGIVGIVASKIVEKYHKPTIMIAIEDEGIGKGSARSIKGLNIYYAIKNSKELLASYGGHEQAAGLSIEENNISQFRRETNQYADQVLTEDDLTPRLKLDAKVSLSELSMGLVEELNSLAPFGLNNPRPKFAVEGVTVNNFKIVGKNDEHLQLFIKDEISNDTVKCIGFNMAEFRELLLTQRDKIDLACTLDINEWKGNRELQLNIKDIKFPELSFIDKLFTKSEAIIEGDYYRGIGEADQFYTKVVGVTFEGRQDIIKDLESGDELKLVREPNNEYDESAIKVETISDQQIGYLNANLAQYLAPYLDVGFDYKATVSEITGGGEKNLGVNIFIIKEGYKEAEVQELSKEKRARLATLNQPEILEEIRECLIGEYDFRSKQKEVLGSLAEGQNTLAIFGTGRGKSAIFQSYAALRALNKGEITVVLYPLRALVNDQFDNLRSTLTPLGLDIYKANGSLSITEREELMVALNQGELDILLTTPEFFEYHLDKFQSLKDKIKFLVVDESHHIGLASNSFRPTYNRLNKLIRRLNNPLVLAVTATANDQVAKEIIETLEIEQIIIDPHIRSNLEIVDKRNCNDKDKYLRKLLSNGKKSIIYVNSREKSIEIASDLREELPELSGQITFYNAGLTNKERNTVEDMFRNDELKIVVSTSAFGEGINIPDIRNVVLYHLNFNLTEFNQQSGRVGRDGKKAYIHLLFEDRDAKINKFILDSIAPEREVLASLYRVLRKLEDNKQEIRLTNQQLADEVNNLVKRKVSDSTISAGLGILEELDLLTRIREAGERIIQLKEAPENKLDLSDSLRYQEGQEDKFAFNKFKKLILKESAEKLLSLINKPIYPNKFIEIKEED
ncbi:single-stranded-DNA-specific exonuclease RecJ [Selenihalanaerobacter shriftii]|uniref:Single-stranded-DNA-specific exonuclease RecJ n=1 Tax=Selenihalanaerobacter shriftii TaxID=142842 RepID=A0A1T4MZ98_9FIRM|nr:single-stranded-DNA-specific exonuclease RecJ [Selenihalanaerobacter shriftii]SJZ72389.1 single-stranded-DNA-specific exonuclease [Selenihalanaerobacter shriftii]